jgi:hypothetical protein
VRAGGQSTGDHWSVTGNRRQVPSGVPAVQSSPCGHTSWERAPLNIGCPPPPNHNNNHHHHHLEQQTHTHPAPVRATRNSWQWRARLDGANHPAYSWVWLLGRHNEVLVEGTLYLLTFYTVLTGQRNIRRLGIGRDNPLDSLAHTYTRFTPPIIISVPGGPNPYEILRV